MVASIYTHTHRDTFICVYVGKCVYMTKRDAGTEEYTYFNFSHIVARSLLLAELPRGSGPVILRMSKINGPPRHFARTVLLSLSLTFSLTLSRTIQQ